MFGRLRVPQGALDEAQKELYRGHYCALCHSLDGWGGKLASLLTSYDVTFWLLLLAALEEPGPPSYRPCTALPFRQVPVLPLRPESRALVAALSLALVGAKVEDDRADGDRPWLSWAFWPLNPSWKRALPELSRLGFPVDAIQGMGAWQRSLEAGAEDLLQLTQPTRALLSSTFGYLAEHCARPVLRQPLEELGDALGLWIYLFDAHQDRAHDRKKGTFNALQRFPQAADELAFQMNHALQHARSALARLPLGPRRPLLEVQIARLARLTREEFGLAPASSSWPCWVMGGGLALASLGPTASVACDGCDCGGCEGASCDCGGCEGCHCEGCNLCESCNLCETCNCEGLEACEGCCNCSDPCCSNMTWSNTSCDCCCFSERKPKPTNPPVSQDPALKPGEIPGATRARRKWPWSKKTAVSPEEPLSPEKPPPDPAEDGAGS